MVDSSPSKEKPKEEEKEKTKPKEKETDKEKSKEKASKEKSLKSEQEVLNHWNQLRTSISGLYSKITELQLEMSEHNLVIGAIEPMEPSRRCYRMIGGVLVERTVAEVLPAVVRNRDGLKEVVEKLTENLQTKKVELEKLEKTYNIRIRRADEIQAEEKKANVLSTSSASQGVLVGPVAGSS